MTMQKFEGVVNEHYRDQTEQELVFRLFEPYDGVVVSLEDIVVEEVGEDGAIINFEHKVLECPPELADTINTPEFGEAVQSVMAELLHAAIDHDEAMMAEDFEQEIAETE
jgi:hypothetical protein